MTSRKQSLLKSWLYYLPALTVVSVPCLAEDGGKSALGTNGSVAIAFINPYETTEPAVTNSIHLFKQLEPWPQLFTGVSLRLKQAGSFTQASGYDAMGTASAALATKCSELHKLVLRRLVATTNLPPADFVLFGAYADLELTIQSIQSLPNGPALRAFTPDQMADLRRLLAAAQQVRARLVGPAAIRFARYNLEINWDEFVETYAGRPPRKREPAQGPTTPSSKPVKLMDPSGTWTWAAVSGGRTGATTTATFEVSGTLLTGRLKSGRLQTRPPTSGFGIVGTTICPLT